jgi:hypothetical protein
VTSLLALSVDKNLAGQAITDNLHRVFLTDTYSCALCCGVVITGGSFVFYFVSVIALLGFAAGGLIVETAPGGVRYD